jgi:hypothetical protein
MTIIKTESFDSEVDGFEADIANRIWEKEKEGIVALAVRGLKDLCDSGGKFLKLESSKKLVEEMQDRGDIVSRFFTEVKANEVPCGQGMLEMNPNKEMKKSELWEVFDNWQRGEIKVQWQSLGRTKAHLEFRKVLKTRKTSRCEYYCGIGSVVDVGGGS